MEANSFLSLRIWALLAMVGAETSGLVHYWKSSSFAHYFALCIFGTIAMIALYWIDTVERLGIPRGVIAFGLLFLAPDSNFSLGRIHVETAVYLAFVGLVVSLLIFKVLDRRKAKKSPSSVDQAGSGVPEWSREGDFNPFWCLIFSGMLVVEVTGDLLFGDRSVFWLVPVVPPFCWYLWQYFVYRKKEKQLNPNENLSLLQ